MLEELASAELRESDHNRDPTWSLCFGDHHLVAVTSTSETQALPLDTIPSVDQLANALDCSWPSLVEARQFTRQVQAQLVDKVATLVPPDASLVVSGSLAREEATPQSDVDWSLLIDGQAYASHLTSAQDVESQLIELSLATPGAERTFGGLVFSHELIHYIGGESDTNANTTRRLLLLLESAAIGPSEVHARVVRQILKRYVVEDVGLLHNRTEGIPRFLLNDIVRFWRTMAVDFAYKRRARQTKGWALRTVKLRLSRKLTYVAGLLTCYSCARFAAPEVSSTPERALEIVDHLASFIRQTPLDMLASTLLTHLSEPGFEQAARHIFDSYDSFVQMISDQDQRRALNVLTPDAVATDALYDKARKLGHNFQTGLNTLFLDTNNTPLYRLTRSYGIF